jgi:hypothetical protein
MLFQPDSGHVPTGVARRRRRVARTLALLLIVASVSMGWSYNRALRAPGTDPWSARSVEWLKNNGLSGVVNSIEHWWYTNHPPRVGGQPPHGLPSVAATSGITPHRAHVAVVAHLAKPVNMLPLVATPLPGEGVWQPTGRAVAGQPAVYTTFFRPDSIHTSLVVGAMWMDTKLLDAAYVQGLQEPGGASPWGAEVPAGLRSTLIAAFNSGFKISDARGGVYANGRVVRPLITGAASFVIDTSGTPNVGAWGRDFSMSANIAVVRQNLALIVDHGRPVAGLPNNTDGAWGQTVGNQVLVWRSGVGVDRHGALVYVAGPGLSAYSLAVLLERAGAIRAMELDINTMWVSAYTYQQSNPLNAATIYGVKLLPDMYRAADRYLTPGERDFFALFAAR